MVYVRSIDGTPLMPCSEAKARRLLKQHRARRVKNTPFTIRLRFVVDGHTQPVSLGVDSGYQHVGLSATANGKVLFEAVAECRTDISKLMESRRSLRSSRRNCKTRYREPRFNNRVHSKHKGWLAPSVEQRIGYHMHLIDYVCDLLPVSRIVVEVAKFDIQKLKDDLIKGEAYQHGEQYGFENVKEYIRFRDGFKCRRCHCKGGPNVRLEIHHIIWRCDGGTDRPNNLVTLCHECHSALHRGEFTLCRPKSGYKAPTFMGIMRIVLTKRLKAKYGDMVGTTYGYITRTIRNEAGVPKDHNTDARAISGDAKARPNGVVWEITKYRCHNRKLHREVPGKGGIRQSKKATRRVHGFGLHDMVVINDTNDLCYISGLRTRGYFAVRTVSDNRLLNPKYDRLVLLERAGGVRMVPHASSI